MAQYEEFWSRSPKSAPQHVCLAGGSKVKYARSANGPGPVGKYSFRNFPACVQTIVCLPCSALMEDATHGTRIPFPSKVPTGWTGGIISALFANTLLLHSPLLRVSVMARSPIHPLLRLRAHGTTCRLGFQATNLQYDQC